MDGWAMLEEQQEQETNNNMRSNGTLVLTGNGKTKEATSLVSR